MNKHLKIEKQEWILVGVLGIILMSYVYLFFDGYKLFNGANTNKYDPKKEHHYHK